MSQYYFYPFHNIFLTRDFMSHLLFLLLYGYNFQVIVANYDKGRLDVKKNVHGEILLRKYSSKIG